jgi:hypothetical protein
VIEWPISEILTTGNGHNIQNSDSDQIPTHDVDSTITSSQSLTSSTGMAKLVVGLQSTLIIVIGPLTAGHQQMTPRE